MSGFAWVTLATNDSYSLGALVLAHSLKQVGTKHQLAVLITPGVTNAMREKLAAVFNLVEEVNPLDSKDEANLRLLKRPELGITFTKLHCWRLVQFQKCVFLDADTLVLSNSDELFEREEFSAAPDVGWPDCFNSGVFVYKPSNETYSKLVDFALLKGSFDGGDQGLLNLYFSDWAHTDIAKHLPFIYNMCSTAVYSYLPAFKQYGKNAKIVHFIGPAKPWLQYFNTETLTVYPSPGLQHLEDVLQMWWNIFCSLIHPNLTREMSGLAGAFAQFTLGAKRSAGQDALENHLRRQAWEVGNIDYLGRDSFDHIWTKICESMAVPVQEAAPQPDAGEKTGAKAPEVIGDVPTADGTQQISCTADAVQPIQETPVPPSPLDATTPKSPAQPDAEPPKTEVSAPVAEGPISLEPSVSVTPETVSSEGAVTKPEEKPIGEVIPKAPIETKQAESASVPSQEPAPTVPAGELSKDVIQTIPLETPKDISPKEVASTDLPKTVEVPPSEVPKTEAVSQEIRKSEAVVAETPKAEAVPVETLKTESAPVEIPKTEVIPVDVSKTETPLETSKVEDTLTEASKPAAMPSETPKIEAVPTTTEETRKPDAPTTEPAPTIPPQAVIAETVSTIVTPPTPTDATELDTPTAEAPPAIPLPDVPKAEVATGGAPPVPEVPSVTEAVPVAEPTKSDIPLPEPLTGIESVPERQKEVPVEETKEGDVISKAEDSTKVEASKPAEAAEAPKKEEKISPKTEEVKSEVIPSEVQQQPIEVAAPQEEIKVEAVTEAALQEEEKKIEAEPPKVEAEASKAEAEAPKAEAEAPKVTGEASKAEAEAPKTTPEAAEQKPEDKPKKKIVKKVKKVPRSEPGAPKVEAATVPEEQPEVAGGEASTPTPPPRKTTTVKKVKAKKP